MDDSATTSEKEGRVLVIKMGSLWLYVGIFLLIPWIIAVLIALIVVVIGCLDIIEKAKLVRIIYPYIKRSGNNTVVFGYKLTKYSINGLFFAMSWIIYVVIWVFLTNIFIIYKNNENPYSGTSHEVKCVDDNDTDPKNILCFGFNFNLAGAMGQATGALALGWIFTSIATYAMLKAKRNNNETECQYYRYKNACFCFGTIIGVIYVVLIYIIISLKHNEKWLYFYILRPENALIFTISGAVSFILDKNIKKEPKSLEECCRETMEAQKNEEGETIKKIKITERNAIDVAKDEYVKLLIQKMENKENKKKGIVQKAFDELTQDEVILIEEYVTEEVVSIDVSIDEQGGMSTEQEENAEEILETTV